jgi:hypothetical protein
MNRKWRKISQKENRDRVLSDIKDKYKISDEDFEKLLKI